MKAEPLSVGKILSEKQRFVVPIYQRTYSWTIPRQLETLMQQLVDKAAARLADQRSLFGHYMGALLVIPDGETTFGRIQPFFVVDGQQRLTTFHLLYAALRDVARSMKLAGVERQLADLLIHPDSTPMQDPANERYKLQPTKYDRASYRFLVDNDEEAIRKKYIEQSDDLRRYSKTPRPSSRLGCVAGCVGRLRRGSGEEVPRGNNAPAARLFPFSIEKSAVCHLRDGNYLELGICPYCGQEMTIIEVGNLLASCYLWGNRSPGRPRSPPPNCQ